MNKVPSSSSTAGSSSCSSVLELIQDFLSDPFDDFTEDDFIENAETVPSVSTQTETTSPAGGKDKAVVYFDLETTGLSEYLPIADNPMNPSNPK